MSDPQITANISGGITGSQVAVGSNIAQTQTVSQGPPVTDAERAELAQLFADLKAQVAAQAAPEVQQSATERVDELEEAINAEKPDMSTIEYVKNWFLKKLPGLAGLVTGVLVNPIVGKLVHSAGEAVVDAVTQDDGDPAS